ncbi:MAG: hypothetical protein K6E98_13410 [Lachnospiraceae bacterium]|nr:hypothetical protein [Lachnospiraceae bacterium]
MDNILCSLCNNEIDMEKSLWDESGYGYSTKLLKCPQCGIIYILKYIEDENINLNYDLKYYEYVKDVMN